MRCGRGRDRFGPIDATLGIAIWGAVTGTVATIGGVVGLTRDRPRLRASQSFELLPQDNAWGEGTLILLVMNEGRQPLTVVDAGFAVKFATVGRWPRRYRVVESAYADVKGPELPLRLEPGAPIEVRIGLSRIRAEPDFLPQGFATGPRGKVIVAEPAMTVDVLLGLPGVRTPISSGPSRGQ